MLTIFATTKAFRGHFEIIQKNAIQSWLRLRPACEVILFGNEEGAADVAAELGIKHVPDMECNEYGTPLLSSLLGTAQDMASHQLMCFVNSDIILMSDFPSAVKQVGKYPFLMVGQRWDLGVDEPVNFDDAQWEYKLRARLAKQGQLHPQGAISYFVFSRGLLKDIPPLAIGRTGEDNWIIYKACSSMVPVIDATNAITAIHQKHDYSHHPQGKAGVWKGPEAKRNLELLGGPGYSLGIEHATWILTPRGLTRALTLKHLCARFDALPVLVPRLHFLGLPKRIMIALSKAIRSLLGRPRQ